MDSVINKKSNYLLYIKRERNNAFIFIFLFLFAISANESNTPGNYHSVDEQVFRSSQPNKKQFKYLYQNGLKSVINLRHTANDKSETRNLNLTLYHIPINSWTIKYDELVTTLKTIELAPKPTLIHCLHGSDRTGAVIAAYRICFQNYTKEQAIEELLNPTYGYHKNFFPSIKKMIEDLDIDKLKKDVKEKIL